jgi:hypothetical protein
MRGYMTTTSTSLFQINCFRMFIFVFFSGIFLGFFTLYFSSISHKLVATKLLISCSNIINLLNSTLTQSGKCISREILKTKNKKVQCMKYRRPMLHFRLTINFKVMSFKL